MKYLLTLLILFSFNIQANSFCDTSFDEVPVQSGGRVKPYFVLAKENIKFITGSSKLDGMSASKVFCLLTISSLVETNLDLPIKVEYTDTKKLLELETSTTSIKESALKDKMQQAVAEYRTLKRETSYKKDLQKVITRFQTIEAIRSGKAWTIPKVTDEKTHWHTFSDLFTTVESLDEAPSKILIAASDYTNNVNDTHLTELFYFKAHLFGYALAALLIAIFLLVVIKKKTLGLSFIWISIAIQITAMTLRIIISGRAPITNMYETVMFSGFGALIISLITYHFKKDIIFCACRKRIQYFMPNDDDVCQFDDITINFTTRACFKR
jgi:hypothetical protein